jgi:hypothetical protein
MQRAAATLLLEVRPRVRAGDVLPVQITTTATIGARSTPPSINFELFIDQHKAFDPSFGAYSRVQHFRGRNGGAGSRMALLPPVQGRLFPGPHTLTANVKVGAWQRGGKPLWGTVTFSQPWTLLPHDQQTVTLRADESLRQRVRASIVIRQPFRQGMNLTVLFDIVDAPIGIGFMVWARYGGMEAPIGRIAVPGKPGRQSVSASGPARGLRPESVDIILRADPAAGVGTVDVFEIWNGELEFKNVQVAR